MTQVPGEGRDRSPSSLSAGRDRRPGASPSAEPCGPAAGRDSRPYVPWHSQHSASRHSPERPRAAARDLGVHRLSLLLLAVHAAGLALVVIVALAVGPPVAWHTAVVPVLLLGVLGVVWTAHVREPGHAREWVVAETLAAVGVVVLATMWLGPAQYLAAGLGRPLIDPVLAEADRWLGVNVADWARWTATQPRLSMLLTVAYQSLIAQFALAQLTAGLFLRDRAAVWEYSWHFTTCGVVTLVCSALWPAASAFQFLDFESTLSQDRFIRHFTALRAGTLGHIDMRDLEGLISMPSFHVLGALMVTWAVRGHPVTLAIALLVNVLLIPATVLSGAHYLVDVVAALPVFVASVLAWRRWGHPLLFR